MITKANEALSSHEVTLALLDTNPVFQCLGITIWLVDWWCNVCLFTWWSDSRFLLQRFWHWKPVDLNSRRISPWFYKRTDQPSALVTQSAQRSYRRPPCRFVITLLHGYPSIKLRHVSKMPFFKNSTMVAHSFLSKKLNKWK